MGQGSPRTLYADVEIVEVFVRSIGMGISSCFLLPPTSLMHSLIKQAISQAILFPSSVSVAFLIRVFVVVVLWLVYHVADILLLPPWMFARSLFPRSFLLTTCRSLSHLPTHSRLIRDSSSSFDSVSRVQFSRFVSRRCYLLASRDLRQGHQLGHHLIPAFLDQAVHICCGKTFGRYRR